MKHRSVSPSSGAAGRDSAYVRGTAIASVAAITISGTFIFSKLLTARMPVPLFTALWFGVAGTFGLAAYLLRYRALPPLPRSALWAILAVGVLNGLSALLFFQQIAMTDPAIVSFFSRIETVNTVLLGVIILRERLTARDILGIGLVVGGALLVTYASGEIVMLVFGLAIVQTFLHAGSLIAGKVAAPHVPPLALSTYRSLITALIAAPIALMSLGAAMDLSPGTWGLLAFGALLGPFGSYVLVYRALRDIDAWLWGVLSALQSFLVVLYSWGLFGTLPSPRQVIGGSIAVIGAIVVVTGPRAAQSRDQQA
jgi:drug/metabolite transporter (DMT)-like permease